VSFQNDCDTALYTALSASTAVTSLLSGGTASPQVWRAVAPQGTTTPYVVFAAQSPSIPRRVLSGVAYESALYTVKAVVQSNSASLAGTIASRIDTALDGPTLTFAGHAHMRCSRVQDIDYPEIAPDGSVYQHRGAIYRIDADPT